MKPKEQSFLAIGNIRDDGIECIGIATRLFGIDCHWNCHLTLLLPVPQDTLSCGIHWDGDSSKLCVSGTNSNPCL